MFGLDPFSSPVAVAEIFLLLGLAAFIGWLLGRLVRGGRVNTLRSAIAIQKTELEKCRDEKNGNMLATNVMATEPTFEDSINTAGVAESKLVMETPQLFVSTDPLLPAYAHNDTPAPITAEPLPSLDEPFPAVDETLPSISSTLEFPPIEEAVFASESPVIAASPATASTEDRETVVLNRIAGRASELNFDRIGRAVATEADDLKDIVGVGPFLERKLHTLGIYTFRQIANFTKEDMHKVNEIVEFFPGRIERDDWVGQSKVFYERKYGKES